MCGLQSSASASLAIVRFCDVESVFNSGLRRNLSCFHSPTDVSHYVCGCSLCRSYSVSVRFLGVVLDQLWLSCACQLVSAHRNTLSLRRCSHPSRTSQPDTATKCTRKHRQDLRHSELELPVVEELMPHDSLARDQGRRPASQSSFCAIWSGIQHQLSSLRFSGPRRIEAVAAGDAHG